MSFQNCSKGFNDTAGSSVNSSVGLDSTVPHGVVPQILMSNGTVLESSSDMTFSVHSDLLPSNLTYSWSHTFKGVLNGCAAKSDNKSATYTINCGGAGDLEVFVSITSNGVTTTVTPMSAAIVDSNAAVIANELKVNFIIPSGTESKPWNTAMTVVETFIGQTLTLTNQDDIVHRMHTAGAPCPHGTDIAPGGTYDCVIKTAYDPSAKSVYDHYKGNTALFYVVAYDGQKLYETNCKSCHESPGTAPKLDPGFATVEMIRNNINATGSPMNKSSTLPKLTERQLQAISNYLGAYGVK